MNGGILIQHVTGHAIGETHDITDGEKVVSITSTHHQMQYPFCLEDRKDYDTLYWAYRSRSSCYKGEGVVNVPYEPEIVYYHVEGKPNSLAIQGHPEMMRKNAPVINLLNELLHKCLQDVH